MADPDSIDTAKTLTGAGLSGTSLTLLVLWLKDKFRKEDSEQLQLAAGQADIDKRLAAVEAKSGEHATLAAAHSDLDKRVSSIEASVDKRVSAVEARVDSIDGLAEDVADLKELRADVRQLIKEFGEARSSEAALVREFHGMNMRFVRLEVAIYMHLKMDPQNLPQTGGDTFISQK